jgi:hypothetical protein
MLMLSVSALGGIFLNVIVLNVVMLRVSVLGGIMLSVIVFVYPCALCHCVGCPNAELPYSECHCVVCYCAACPNAELRYAKCHYLCLIVPRVLMLNCVVMLSISAMSGLMLDSVMPRVILPGVVVLNVVMHNVVAPLIFGETRCQLPERKILVLEFNSSRNWRPIMLKTSKIVLFLTFLHLLVEHGNSVDCSKSSNTTLLAGINCRPPNRGNAKGIAKLKKRWDGTSRVTLPGCG